MMWLLWVALYLGIGGWVGRQAARRYRQYDKEDSYSDPDVDMMCLTIGAITMLIWPLVVLVVAVEPLFRGGTDDRSNSDH